MLIFLDDSPLLALLSSSKPGKRIKSSRIFLPRCLCLRGRRRRHCRPYLLWPSLSPVLVLVFHRLLILSRRWLLLLSLVLLLLVPKLLVHRLAPLSFLIVPMSLHPYLHPRDRCTSVTGQSIEATEEGDSSTATCQEVTYSSWPGALDVNEAGSPSRTVGKASREESSPALTFEQPAGIRTIKSGALP